MVKRYFRIGIILILALANLFVWFVVFREDRRGILTVAFLDVGQGDAIYIEAPNGNQVLLDGGPGKKVLQELGRVMPFYDRSLDLLIASHPDADHIGGLVEVAERFAVGGFMEPGVDSETSAYQLLKKQLAEQQSLQVLARRGMRVVLDQGVLLEILFPDRDPAGFATNDASIVGKLVYGGTAVLLTGDAPLKIENYLVERDGKNLRANVLKAGHHGSRTSSGEQFVGWADPDYAVISVGQKNRYGHPHPEVLALFQRLGVQTLRTDEQGTIIFQSDGQWLSLK